MPTRALGHPGFALAHSQCGQPSITGGSKVGDAAQTAGQEQLAARKREGTEDSLEAPNVSHPILIRQGTFKRCRELLKTS